MEKKGQPPAKIRRHLGGALDAAAFVVDTIVVGSEVLGLSGLAAKARPLAVGLRLVARVTRGRS